MEDIVDSLKYVADQFLLVLHLNRGVWLEQWIAWNGDLDLDISTGNGHIETRLLVRRDK